MRLTGITSPAGAFTYAYDPQRQALATLVTFPNGTTITKAYDALARLLSTHLLNSESATLNSHSYSCDLVGHRIQQVLSDGDVVRYAHDNIGQLLSAQSVFKDVSAANGGQHYGYLYDSAGNLNFRTMGAEVEAFNINGLNELTTSTRSRYADGATNGNSLATYTYDLDGNVLSVDQRQFDYDDES
jgi:uncharacterized protein RhaS with RHS repeats